METADIENNQSSIDLKVASFKAIDIISNTSLFTKALIFFNILFYALSWIFPDFVLFFANVPSKTVYSLRLFSIVTAPLVSTSLFNLLTAAALIYFEGQKKETKDGTVKFMLEFFFHSAVLQVLFTFIVIIISFFYSGTSTWVSCGMWPFLIFDLSLRSFKKGEEKLNMLIVNYQFKAKYHPFVFLAVLTVINNSFPLDGAISVGLAYLVVCLNFIQYVEMKDLLVKKVENIKYFEIVKQVKGFKNGEGKEGLSDDKNEDDFKGTRTQVSDKTQEIDGSEDNVSEIDKDAI